MDVTAFINIKNHGYRSGKNIHRKSNVTNRKNLHLPHDHTLYIFFVASRGYEDIYDQMIIN